MLTREKIHLEMIARQCPLRPHHEVVLQKRGFEPQNFQHICTAMQDFFAIPGLSLENKGIRFQEGRLVTVQKRDADSRELMKFAISGVIDKCNLSFRQNVALITKVSEVIGDFALNATVRVTVVESTTGGAEASIEIPFATWSHCLLAEEDRKEITLPLGLTIANFQDFLLDRFDTPQILQMLQIAESFFDAEMIQRCLTVYKKIENRNLCLSHVRIALEHLPYLSYETGSRYFSIILNNHLYHFFKNLQKVSDIVTHLQTLVGFDEARFRPLSLDLSVVKLQDGDLEYLETVFPNVYSLNISGLKLERLPCVWANSLRNLDISWTSIVEIPLGFIALERFIAVGAERLTQVDHLAVLPHLREVDVINTSIPVQVKGAFPPAVTVRAGIVRGFDW